MNTFQLKSKLTFFSAVLCFFITGYSYSQTVVNSLESLSNYLDDNNANVKLAPGTYTINASNANKFGGYETIGTSDYYVFFNFSGNNSTFDFTGVKINVETPVFRLFGNVDVYEIRVEGNNNLLKNLTIEDVGSVHDNPRRGALSVAIDGKNNVVDGFHVTAKGSLPYGYGDIFGKGSGSLTPLDKHSGILIRGDYNTLSNTTMIQRAFGHSVFMQAANHPTIEGCYIEGEVRTTDDILAEEGTGSIADNLDFMTTWGYKLPPGFMIALCEAGIRSYNAGTTTINGVSYSRGTNDVTVKNTVVKNTRSGCTISQGSGHRHVENVTLIGNENGFAIGNGDIINCYADAAYGPAFNSEGGIEGSVTLIEPENGYYNGSKCIASSTGGTFTLNSSVSNIPSDMTIQMGSYRSFRHQEGSTLLYQVTTNFSNATLYNHSTANIHLGTGAKNSDIFTCGSVDNDGSGNSINYWDDCDVETTGCTNYVSNINPPANLVPGVSYNYYEGTWDVLPNFGSLTAETSGIVSGISLGATSTSADYFGYTFEGYINVPSEGEYTFYTSSDDGSGLWINDNQVVNNDGLHGTVEKSGQVCLEAGYHKIHVEYFEKTGGNTLSVAYSGPGISKTSLPSLYTQVESVSGTFTPDPNKTYYIDAPYHNLRLAADGDSGTPTTTSTNATGANVEWKFVAKGNGSWHIQRAAGGTLPRLRTDNTISDGTASDMQETAWSGSYTYFDFTEGAIAGTYFITLPDGPAAYVRLQIDSSGNVQMVENTRNGTWESFTITEVGGNAATDIFLEAEDHDGMSGIQTQGTTDTNGGENVGWIHNGDWLRFDDVNLSGLSNMDARISCNFTGGTIEVRTGGTSGTLIGSISVTNTGGNQSWVTKNTNISGVNGTQDVYLVFKGGSGYLFNINWLEFNTSSTANKDIVASAVESEVTIYPNPVSSTTTIENAANSIINIYDMNGSLMLSQTVSGDSENLDLSLLSSGMYYTEVIGSIKTSIVKLIKN